MIILKKKENQETMERRKKQNTLTSVTPRFSIAGILFPFQQNKSILTRERKR